MTKFHLVSLTVLFVLGIRSQECDDPGQEEFSIRLKLADESYLYTCNDGYVARDGTPSVLLTCENGLWGPYNPPSMGNTLCVELETTTGQATTSIEEETTISTECKDPGQVENAERIENGFTQGANVYYTCNAGYCPKDHRSRTIILECLNGEWSQDVPICEKCNMCNVMKDKKLKERHIKVTPNEDTFTALVECDEGYSLIAGTDISDKTIDCIEGGVWSPELPICFRRPDVQCGEDYISVVINRNMLDNLGYAGGINNLALTGPDTTVQYVDPECYAISDSSDSNYVFTITTPFADKCRTKYEQRDNDYHFSNKIVWRHMNNAVARSATLLDFECVYQGLINTALQKPIKLAISTRTYTAKNGNEFIVSMGIYHQRDYTGLIDNAPVIHQGKRYFVELMMHNPDQGTPYLKHCYGTANAKSNEELSASDPDFVPVNTRSFIIDGCPAPRTLARLEVPPGDEVRRFSFMFPKLDVGLAYLPFIYVHCDIELKPIGFRPTCFRQNDIQPGAMGNIGRRQGNRLGRNQFLYRRYGLDNNGNLDHDQTETLLEALLEKRRGPATPDFSDKITARSNMKMFMGRKKRSISDDTSYPIAFGPLVMVAPTDVEPSDIKEETIDLILPFEMSPEGLLDFVDNQEGETVLRFNTTFRSIDQDELLFKKLFPQELIRENTLENNSKFNFYAKGKENTDLNDDLEELEAEVAIKEIEKDIENRVNFKDSHGSKAVTVVVIMLCAGVALFVISILIGLKTNICQVGNNNHKKIEKQSSGIPTAVVNGPKSLKYDQREIMNNIKNQESCGTSMTSEE